MQMQTGSPPDPERADAQKIWHVVQPGENLTMIARAYYGPEHGDHWITLYNFNRKLVGENPDLIQPGMELLIPDIPEFL
jgi:nucleoid-associated protein YgaU